MPSLHSVHLQSLAASVVVRDVDHTGGALQVVCAWPVSGQYGPGSRLLYYVLVAACVLARKSEWLRSACLAAALLFPAVAAIHGIVLAAVHVDGAVDLDVYGAFQLCAIGVLAAPVTAKLSSTYFNDPGRNTIFLWTILLLAGLLSLTVEFYRSNPLDCTEDGRAVPANSTFNYSQPQCKLDGCFDDGPLRSQLRRDAASDIYVIPAPTRLTFGAATLLAAGCCIPAILSLVSMWSKILKTNWKSQFGPRDANAHIDGTKATEGKMRGVNEVIRRFLSVVEVPIFSAAVLAILVIGENNFFSRPMTYRTEPIASVGQWAPIVGTILAIVGSLYLLWASNSGTLALTPRGGNAVCDCACLRRYDATEGPEAPELVHDTPVVDVHGAGMTMLAVSTLSSDHQTSTIYPSARRSRGSSESLPRGSISSSSPPHTPGQPQTPGQRQKGDEGGRLRVAKAITAVAEYIGTASPDRFDDSAFQHGDASDFPEIPGEEQRNRGLNRIRLSYNQPREDEADDGQVIYRPRSRAISFDSRTASRVTVEERLTRSRTTSPRRPRAHSHGDGPVESHGHFEAEARVVRPRHHSDALDSSPVPCTTATFPTHAPATDNRTIEVAGHGSPIIIVSNAD